MPNQTIKTLLCLLAVLMGASSARAAQSKPNFIVIFADDLGYGDIGCFGSRTIKTPQIDRMAKEGLRFTNFYAQTVCGPSRAALMTGCYPLRVAVEKNRVEVHPHLHTDEITIAEMLKEVGYTSAAFGKWDLAGHSQTKYSPKLLPTHQGFDYFFGTPTSNDSVVNLLRNEGIVERKADMSRLTRRYTDEAIEFIKRSKNKPFFVYLAHTMPHVRLAVSESFKGKSAGGLYGDVVEEIDWNVGRLLQALKANRLDEKTYVIFTSDNGPWYFGRSPGHKMRMGDNWAEHGGSAAPLRGAKTSTWEGGLRVPFVVRAPGKIPAGIWSDTPTSTMDLLPTFAKLAGGQVPADRVIDGRDITALFDGADGSHVENKPYYFYRKTRLEAVRLGKWKLHVVRPEDQAWAKYSTAEDAAAIAKPMLYDVKADMGESNNVAAQHPEVVAELMTYIEKVRSDIGDFDRIGKNARFFDPEPRRPDIVTKPQMQRTKRKADSK
jgi:arylsulfatase A-like enzyme